MLPGKSLISPLTSATCETCPILTTVGGGNIPVIPCLHQVLPVVSVATAPLPPLSSLQHCLTKRIIKAADLLQFTPKDLLVLAEILLDSGLFYRFSLKAHHNTEMALKLLTSHLDWRMEEKPHLLSSDSFPRVSTDASHSTCSPPAHPLANMLRLHGVDRQGRPVVYVNLSAAIGHPIPQVEQYMIYFMECCRRLLQNHNDAIPDPSYHTYQMIAVVYLDSSILSLLTYEAISRLFPLFQSHYPQCFAHVIVLGYSWLFGSLWHLLSSTLPASSTSKVIFAKQLTDYIAPEFVMPRGADILQAESPTPSTLASFCSIFGRPEFMYCPTKVFEKLDSMMGEIEKLASMSADAIAVGLAAGTAEASSGSGTSLAVKSHRSSSFFLQADEDNEDEDDDEVVTGDDTTRRSGANKNHSASVSASPESMAQSDEEYRLPTLSKSSCRDMAALSRITSMDNLRKEHRNKSLTSLSMEMSSTSGADDASSSSAKRPCLWVLRVILRWLPRSWVLGYRRLVSLGRTLLNEREGRGWLITSLLISILYATHVLTQANRRLILSA